MGGWNFITLRIPPLFQSPLLLGDLMGKVKAMYAEMEERNNWKEADIYYNSKEADDCHEPKYGYVLKAFHGSYFGIFLHEILKRLDDAEYKIHKLEKEKEV